MQVQVPKIVDIPQGVKDALRDFRLKNRSPGSAIVVKINREKQMMEVEDLDCGDDNSIERLAEELPGNSPRYVVLLQELKHEDGRTSFPLVLISWCPSSSEQKSLTLHASALIDFQDAVNIHKAIEIRDGPESLTQEVIDSELRAKHFK